MLAISWDWSENNQQSFPEGCFWPWHHSHIVTSPFAVTVLLEISATCRCFYDLSRWGEFACRSHQYECTHVLFGSSLSYCFFFFIIIFYNILYCVILHWYKEPFLVEFCKVYGIANTSKYVAPDPFCHVFISFYIYIILFWLWCVWISLFWLVRSSVWVSVKCCTLLYYFYFYICWYWSWFRLTNKYHLDFSFLCKYYETTSAQSTI